MPRIKGIKTNKIKDTKNIDSRLNLMKHSLCSYFQDNSNDIDTNSRRLVKEKFAILKQKFKNSL